MKRLLILICAIVALPLQARTPTKPIPTISDVAWLVGHWECEGFGGTCEEVWTESVDRSMVGMFRMIKDGKILFYEIMTITEESQYMILRIKHFNPDLKGWEEKDQTVDFPLLHATPTEIGFSGLLYRKMSDGTVKVLVDIKKKAGEVVTEELLYRRKK